MSRVSKSLAVLAAAVVLATAACKADHRVSSFSTSTTTTSTTSTSTTAAPVTTTTGAAAVVPVPVGTKLVMTRTGIVSPVLRVDPNGTVVIRTPCENTTSVAGATPLGPVDVVLDPGHGGNESGAIGANGLAERTVNLLVAKQTEAALRGNGISVLMTRNSDYRVTLTERANIAHAADPKVFVSIHHNGGSDGPRNGPGTEVFYQHASANSRRLAGLIYEEVVAALSQYQGIPWQADADAGAKTRLNNSGGDYYAMIREPAPVVSVIAELLFLSNPPEADLVNRPEVQRVEGEAVARGIIRYLRTNDPGSGYTEAYPRTEPAGGGGGLSGCVDPPLQ